MKRPRYLGYKIKILGHSWTVYYCTRKHFKKVHPELSQVLAVSVKEDKEIYLQRGHLKLETVIHELVHAYLWELCVTSCDMTLDDQTEIFCDFLAKYGKRVLRQGGQIVDAFQILMGREDLPSGD